jgi:hypothetical protein
MRPHLRRPGGAGGWTKQVAVGFTGAFKILTIDTAQKRNGLALVEEGWSAEPDVDEVRADSEPGPAFGSLADQLRNALKDR